MLGATAVRNQPGAPRKAQCANKRARSGYTNKTAQLRPCQHAQLPLLPMPADACMTLSGALLGGEGQTALSRPTPSCITNSTLEPDTTCEYQPANRALRRGCVARRGGSTAVPPLVPLPMLAQLPSNHVHWLERKWKDCLNRRQFAPSDWSSLEEAGCPRSEEPLLGDGDAMAAVQQWNALVEADTVSRGGVLHALGAFSRTCSDQDHTHEPSHALWDRRHGILGK